MTVSIVVAVNEEWCIGDKGDLLYKIDDDLQRFKWLTSTPNSYVLMGRATWDSLPKKPLPNRNNLIFTRNTKYKLDDKYSNNPNVIVEFDIDKVVNHLSQTGNNNDKNIYVIGGAETIAQFAHIADRIHLSLVHDDKKGDTYLNPCFLKEFKKTSRFDEYDEKSGLYYSFINYKRKVSANAL